MKHCHFSILYNEYPFLVQKLPFLYKNFSQIIFYDLGIKQTPYCFSNDGSHEFIKNYPDPENKITLIEKKDLSDVTKYEGGSFKAKRKMFAVGSSYVKDDMDTFWCTDMDEFFTEDSIRKVEKIFGSTDYETIDFRHLVFFFDDTLIYTEPNGGQTFSLFARIARHKPGRLYGHCSLQKQFRPTHNIQDEFYYHFAYVGRSRVGLKCNLYKYPGYMEKIYSSFKPENVTKDCWGYPHMHPNKEVPRGVSKFRGVFPEYLDTKKLVEMLNEK